MSKSEPAGMRRSYPGRAPRNAAMGWALLACAPIACSQLEGLIATERANCTASSAAPSGDGGAVRESGDGSGGSDDAAVGAPDAGNDNGPEEAGGGDGAIQAFEAGSDSGTGEAGDSGNGEGGSVDGGDGGDGGTLSAGLVAYYPFDETSGTSAADASGNGHTATLVGGATFASGLQNNGVTLNGSKATSACRAAS